MLDERLVRVERETLVRLRASLSKNESLLSSLSPLAVLQRGYALVFDESGTLIRDAFATPEGSLLTTRFASGELTSRVIERKHQQER